MEYTILPTVVVEHTILLPLENDGIALIDAADYALVCPYTWYLRTCTHEENMRNRKGNPNSTSVYKGVTWIPIDSWHAAITFKGKKQFLGSYASEKDAAIAYDNAARELFGEFAYLNFPNEVHETPSRRQRDRRAYRKNRPTHAAPVAAT